MTDRLTLQFAHRSLSLGRCGSLCLPIRCRFQIQIPFAVSPLCSGSSGLVFRSNLRQLSPISASLDRGMSNSMVNEAEPKELRDESDFEAVCFSDEYISICGFGSLLSERSARSTFPELVNFRVARLHGFRRVFANVAPVFFERGIAKPETKEISSLCAEPCEGETIIISVFEIKKSEIPAFIHREIEFRFLAVLPERLDGMLYDKPAVLCSRSTDEEFFQVRCKGNKDIYFQHYGRHNIDKIWRDDILPCRVYLRHCVLAAKNLGDEAYNNFLDHTFLGDRSTTIRDYLAANGSGIMEEEPPESLKFRYGG
ncbi:uncharacterized protein LOC111009671 [Momordica charantia]|uniref:Uncharacterized protein LOC111009671 n=1 Tax=Momordica charantia TaxID=3673 RepID=A0A6J1C9Z2_MOMCH|nr:uncharacterized protein LOC111009671 [Momordica charantia]